MLSWTSLFVSCSNMSCGHDLHLQPPKIPLHPQIPGFYLTSKCSTSRQRSAISWKDLASSLRLCRICSDAGRCSRLAWLSWPGDMAGKRQELNLGHFPSHPAPVCSHPSSGCSLHLLSNNLSNSGVSQGAKCSCNGFNSQVDLRGFINHQDTFAWEGIALG